MKNNFWLIGLLYPVTCITLHAEEATNIVDEVEVVHVIGKQESYLNTAVSSATKGLSDPFDIPLTVNIINDVFLSDLRAKTLSDAYGYTTGLSQSGINANSFTLRGLPANLQSIQVNGLPGLASRFGSPTTANVERIEVLKGPASVLYGQLEPGGIVNISTKKPKVEQAINFEISAQTYDTDVSSLGEDNGFTTTLDATGALTANKNWLYRLIVSTDSINSYRDNVDQESYYVFPTLTYRISDISDVTFGIELVKENAKADQGLVALNNDINQTASINTRYQEDGDVDNDEAVVLFATYKGVINDNFDLTANWRSVWHEDNRILFENNRVNDDDGTLRRRDRNQLNKREYHFIDINSRGNIDIGSTEHELILGLNTGFEKRDFERIRFGSSITPDIDVFNPVLAEGEPLAIQSGNDRVTDLFNYGIYLQDIIHFNEQWTVLAGIRYEKQFVDFIEQVSDEINDQITDAFVPSLGVVYKATDTLSLYASYGESFNPNSVEDTNVDGGSFDPEEGKQFEVGFKAFLFEEKANISIAYFDILQDNIVETNDNGDDELLGEVESSGVEVEFLAQPIDNWQIKAGYAYIDSIISKSPTETTEGNPTAFAPKNDFYLWTRYNATKTFKGWLTGVSLGINHESERFTSSDTTTRVALPTYTTFDTAIYFEKEKYSIALNIENIFDKRYFDGGTRDTQLYPGEPRKISLTFSTQF